MLSTQYFLRGVKDLSDPDAASFVFAQADKTLGLADILVNCALGAFTSPCSKCRSTNLPRGSTNQRAPFFLAQAFVRRIAEAVSRPRDPVIVNIASVNALAGNPALCLTLEPRELS